VGRASSNISRWRVRVPDLAQPAPDERFFVRHPGLMRFATAITFRLPVGSRLRRALLKRNVELSYAAQNRGDWRFVVVPYGPRSELHNPPIEGGGEAVAVVQDRYFGREGALQLLEDWTEPFGETRFEPEQVVDLGDGRLLILSMMRARGRASGLEIREPLAQLVEFRGGIVTRQRNWLGSWAEGLAEAGLGE
jgi:ketosteroid isomerase-like protein